MKALLPATWATAKENSDSAAASLTRLSPVRIAITFFGLISFFIKAKSRKEIVTFCESLRHIMMAVSWGGHESLIIPKCVSIDDDDFNPNTRWHRQLRLYVGLEDSSYLMADLEQAFNKIN